MTDPQDLWIQYFINPEFFLTMQENELKKIPHIFEAIELLDVSNFTKGQLYAYDQYLDGIRSNNTNMYAKWMEGNEEGRMEGRMEGRKEGRKEGLDLTLSMIIDLKESKLSLAQIAEKYEVSLDIVEKLFSSL